MDPEVGKYLTEINQRLKKGWSTHISPDGRLYYMNHETKVSSWLPPVESWDSGGAALPYGWEAALDKDGKTYFINHINKTTTYEDPRKDTDEEPPQPREVELVRDSQMGFGFVAGSEKPVIVRFVTEGGPSEHKLLPADQILKINGEDVVKAPREHVIELVRSCKHSVVLTVCQPITNNTTRKSALLTAAKKAKLKNNPSRVRFAEGVVINGSPLYSPSPLESSVPFLPNVLKVFLENGQTKSFKYDSTTTILDVLNSLQEKLSVKCVHHFSLVVEHVKIARRNRLTLLDPKDTLAKIAARPGAHHLRCLFRVTFVPKDAYDLLQKDPIAFEYLYVQCCNDMVQERFAPELKYDIALRLAALHIQQHALSSGMQGKITIKAVERECGLDRFVPLSLLETMKRKELRKLLSHFLKQNQSLCAPGQKQLTALQAKLHYLKIISDLPSYGAKCFSTNIKDSSPETALLISPKFGVSQITCLRNTIPLTLAQIEEVSCIQVTKEDELTFTIELFLKDPDKETLQFSVEDKDAEELVLLLRGYHRLLAGRELPVQWEADDPWRTEMVPCYHNRHTVLEAPWSYPPCLGGPTLQTVDLAVTPPPYVPCDQPDRQLSRSSSREQCVLPISSSSSVDHNMNETQYVTLASQRESPGINSLSNTTLNESNDDRSVHNDYSNRSIDYQSVISMEILEEHPSVDAHLFEAKNEEVIRRISEMNRIVIDAENYLCDDAEEELKVQVVEDAEAIDDETQLKAADSLLLLTQIDNEEKFISHSLEEKTRIVLDEEISPSESDTDSTPNDSPLHRSTPIRNSLNSHSRTVRRDSSFGLHSPDLLPGIDSSNHNIMEILRQLQSNQIQLPFAEGTLYLDPDIIDLTMIPPPITPDIDIRDTPLPLNVPPIPFLDTSALHRELEKWARVSSTIAEEDLESNESWETESSELQGTSSINRNSDAGSVDSARVVAELDHLCDALSELQASSMAQSLPYSSTASLSMTEDIDMFIASVAVPPPPSQMKVNNCQQESDDLAAYIIPPPPSSSPSTEVQNEVIARFKQASEDMKRIIGNGKKCCRKEKLENFPSGLNSDQGLDKSWELSQNLGQNTESNLVFQETLQVLNDLNTVMDTELQSGDSSGYDTLTSSLTSYGEILMNDDANNQTYSCTSDDSPKYQMDFIPSTSSTPSSENSSKWIPSGKNNSLPSSPNVHISCIDTSNLSITSPSSTTSSGSGSSVVQIDSNLYSGMSPRLKKSSPSKNYAYENGIMHSNSFNDFTVNAEENTNLQLQQMARSMSWTSIIETETPCKINSGSLSPPITPKPPLPPSSPLHQTRLRRSGNKGSHVSSGMTKKCELPSLRSSGKSPFLKRRGSSPSLSPQSYSPGQTPPHQRKNLVQPNLQAINGLESISLSDDLMSDIDSIMHPSLCSTLTTEKQELHDVDNDIYNLENGCLDADNLSFSLASSCSNFETVKCDSNNESNGTSCDPLEQNDDDDSSNLDPTGAFYQAQREISAMVLHLKTLSQNNQKSKCPAEVDVDKFVAAKEALIAESRQFVTASKLFVKSAMESSDKMVENMSACVTLLDRIFTVSELVIMHTVSEVHILALVERLKGVALAYSHTVDAAKKAVGRGITNPHMGVLMHQATTLATALTSLMRTLRSLTPL